MLRDLTSVVVWIQNEGTFLRNSIDFMLTLYRRPAHERVPYLPTETWTDNGQCQFIGFIVM